MLVLIKDTEGTERHRFFILFIEFPLNIVRICSKLNFKSLICIYSLYFDLINYI